MSPGAAGRKYRRTNMRNDKLGRLRLDTLRDINKQKQLRFIGITAKYRSKCYVCQKWMDEGSTILWSPEEGVSKHFSKKKCKNYN